MTAKANIQHETIVTIKGGKSSGTSEFDGHRYWEIVDELTWRGADRNQSTDNAKWCARAELGSETSILVSGYPPILLKAKRKIN